MTNETFEPQSVCSPVTSSAIFIVATLNPGIEAVETVRAWCGDIAALTRSVGKRVPAGNLSCVCGFGSSAWDTLFGAPRPASLHPFREFGVDGRRAVATPGDILLHIRADQMDLCFELATQLVSALGDAVTVVDEVQGFRYFDMRSIIGFVDGTENPEPEIAAEYALVGDEDPEFTGGSYAFIQKYTHDMDKWRGLSTEEQEKVIGRKKFNDLELSDEEKPATAHTEVSKARDADGNEVKIMRANMPFANPAKNEYGTFFIGYARSFSITQQMLTHMFQGDAEGNLDSLLDYCTAETGCLFFMPTVDFLDDLGDE